MPIETKPMKIWYQSYVDRALAAPYLDRLQQHLESARDPDTEVTVHGLQPPDSYAHPVVEFRCAHQVIRNAVTAERNGYDAFLLGHIQDSGLYESKSIVDIPVLGLGEISMLYACTLGQKIGIVTINTRFIPIFEQQIRKYGLVERVVGVHALKFEPGEFMSAFNDQERRQKVINLFRAQAEPLVDDGVDVILPGGGIPMLLLGEEMNLTIKGAPVVNGLPIVLKMAELAVKLRRFNGTSVSRTAAFAKPPLEIIEEFLND